MKKVKTNLEKDSNKQTKRDNQKNIKTKKALKTQKTHRDKNIQKKKLKPPDFPESIVRVILDKILSYVIYQTTVKEVYSHMDEKCFNYLKYLITPYLSTEYMFYEDGVEDIKHQKKKFYYKTPVPKIVNTWVNIQEPDAPEIDRYSSSTTKIIPCKTENTDNNNNKDIIPLNFRNIDKQDSKDIKNLRRKSTVVDENLIVSESVEYSKRTKSIRMSSIRKLSYKSKNFNQFNMDIKDKIKMGLFEKKQKRLLEKLKKEEEQKILELTWVDLPKEKYENKYVMKNDDEENNILRKERENIIIKQTELKALKEIQDKKEKLKRFQSRLQKNFDGSRQTFDPNGNIINIHHPQIENLNNEFCFLKVPNIESKSPLKERRKSSISLIKNNDLTKKKSIFDKTKNNVLIKHPLKKINSLKYKGPISEENKEIIKYIKNALIPKWQHRPVKKDFYEDREESEEKEHKKFMANKPFKEFFGSFIQDYIFKEEVEHNPIDRINNIGYYKYDNPKKKVILPSGSNFKKIKPEIGVVVENQNNEKKKEIKDGGFEFIKKYNKPSMYEFSKLLMETSQLNSSKVLSSGLIESKINEINEINNINRNNEANKEEYNYNGYMMEFSDMNNPLFQGALSINDKSRIFSSLSKNKSMNQIDKDNNVEKISIMKGRNVLSSMNEKYLKNRYNSMNSINIQNNSIQLTNNVKAPNLISYFHEDIKESEKKIESENEEEFDNDFNHNFNTLQKEKNKNRNSALPVLRVRKNEIDRFNLNELKNQIKGRKIINKFNYKIIKNKKWGEEDEKKKKEREMMNFGLDSRNSDNNIINQNNDNRNQLKKVGENIINIKDDKYNIRSRRNLFRSASAGNII